MNMRHALRMAFSVKKSIQSQIFVAFIVVILFSLFTVSAIIYYFLTNNIKQNAIDYALNSMKHADENLQIMLKDVEHMGAVIVTNEENVRDIIRSGNYEITYDWFQEKKKNPRFPCVFESLQTIYYANFRDRHER